MQILEQHKFSLDLCRFIAFVSNEGYIITMGEIYRTTEQQQIYVRTGRSKTMNSLHLKRRAFDCNIFTKEGRLLTLDETRPFGEFWTRLNPEKNVWGGSWKSFKDFFHFERRD
jgi:hypothetical protein